VDQTNIETTFVPSPLQPGAAARFLARLMISDGRRCTVGLILAALLGLLIGCGREQPAVSQAQNPRSQGAAAQSVSPRVAAMSADTLREAARKALLEQRLYAPAGNNALEYYVVLRDKVPNDAAVASAVTDLMPYALIAIEQSIAREEFGEALRVHALMVQADPQAPEITRLRRAIRDGQARVAQRTTEASTANPAQTAAGPEAKTERRPAAQRERAHAARQSNSEPDQAQARVKRKSDPAAAPASAQSAPEASTQRSGLRAISTPSPSYPIDALRAQRTGELVVEFTVNQDGSVSNPRVVRANPPRIFDREVLRVVRRWRFEPVAEPITTRRTIEFKLD